MPTDPIITTLIEWFERDHERWPWRATRDRWLVLVSEICLQQTQASRVVPFFECIAARFPTPESLAAAPLHDLLVLWQGLGYPRRARSLHQAAQIIATSGWPERYEVLPGVGPYTADAMRCFADEDPVLPLDINVRRVVARVFPDGAPPPPPDRSWLWGQAVMELGQLHCRARARCDSCPLREPCPSQGTVEVIASPRQAPYVGSMRQRRGVLLRELTAGRSVPIARDPEAAASLIADGLACRDRNRLRPTQTLGDR